MDYIVQNNNYKQYKQCRIKKFNNVESVTFHKYKQHTLAKVLK